MGSMDGVESMSWVHFLIWCAMRKVLAEPIWFQENVPGFPRDIFYEVFPEYEFVFDIVHPDGLGWPIRRERQWVVYWTQWFPNHVTN